MNYLISFAWGLLFLSCDPGVSLLILPAIIISEKGKSTECRALVVWGTNLSSTVGVKFTRTQLSIIIINY
jgi:hypothetical protein